VDFSIQLSFSILAAGLRYSRKKIREKKKFSGYQVHPIADLGEFVSDWLWQAVW